MWFKNIRAYRLTSPFTVTAEQLTERLAARAFAPCAKSQALSMGWVPPLGEQSEALAHAGSLAGCLPLDNRAVPMCH